MWENINYFCLVLSLETLHLNTIRQNIDREDMMWALKWTFLRFLQMRGTGPIEGGMLGVSPAVMESVPAFWCWQGGKAAMLTVFCLLWMLRVLWVSVEAKPLHHSYCLRFELNIFDIISPFLPSLTSFNSFPYALPILQICILLFHCYCRHIYIYNTTIHNIIIYIK